MHQCSFELNNQPMSALSVSLMSFPAFSGLGSHVNQRASACIPDFGPIPPGTYYILDRQSGGFLGPLWDRVRGSKDWFALYANDGRINDFTFCNHVERGHFRLHPKVGLGISKGCITIASQAHFNQLRSILKSVKPVPVAGGIQAYGKVLVR